MNSVLAWRSFCPPAVALISLSRVAVAEGFDASRDDWRGGDGIHSREGVRELWEEGRRRDRGRFQPQRGEGEEAREGSPSGGLNEFRQDPCGRFHRCG